MTTVLILIGTHVLVLAAGVYLGDKFNPYEKFTTIASGALGKVKEHLKR